MFEERAGTPAGDGFAMPAEWARHAGTLMEWPCRRELWGERLDEARDEYAGVARAIADFEPVHMVANPVDAADARNRCGSGVEVIELPIDDSWMRDNGPTFVRDADGRLAVVGFGFNAWGDRWHPHDSDAAVPERIARHFGLPFYRAPMVAEGGAFLVDGEGTLLTTEQCLLNPNRNGAMPRAAVEEVLRAYLGVRTVVWLPFGHSLDTGPEGTDGHIDGIAAYVGPGHVLLEVPEDPAATEYATGRANLAALEAARDAAGHPFTVTRLDPGRTTEVVYANLYVANGAVIVPGTGSPADDEPVLARLAEVFADRTVVPVAGKTISFGGGGPHCITQQIPQPG
jgi:agmatine deiminase